MATTTARRFYTIGEIALATGLSKVMIHRQVRDGGIPSTKVGQRRLIPTTWLRTLDPEGKR